jgi:alkyl hydroperoxide reductase subunit AhpC
MVRTIRGSHPSRSDHGNSASRRHRPRFHPGFHRRPDPTSTSGRATPGWCFFSHPADFTPVCTTELGKTAALSGEFAKRGVKPIALSVDPADSSTGMDFGHQRDAEHDGQLSDHRGRRPQGRHLYDMIHPNSLATATVRSVFIIDPKKVIRTTHHVPGVDRPQLRRDPPRDRFAAADRQPQGRHAVNWKHGDDVVIVPSIQDPKPSWPSASPRASRP